jgi:hypothetical protein
MRTRLAPRTRTPPRSASTAVDAEVAKLGLVGEPGEIDEIADPPPFEVGMDVHEKLEGCALAGRRRMPDADHDASASPTLRRSDDVQIAFARLHGVFDSANARRVPGRRPEARGTLEVQVRARRVDEIIVVDIGGRSGRVFDRDGLRADVDDLRARIDVRDADLVVDRLERKDRFLFAHRSGTDPNQAWKPGEAVVRRHDRDVGFAANEVREMQRGRMTGEPRAEDENMWLHSVLTGDLRQNARGRCPRERPPELR